MAAIAGGLANVYMLVQVRLNMMVSAHVRSRAKGIPYAAAQISILSEAYDQWRQKKLAAELTSAGPGP